MTMQLNLVPHPSTPPADPIFKVWANIEHAGALGVVASTNIWFGVGAPASRFVIPEAEEPARKDDLWQTTCFEAFLRAAGADAYREWNFAPSGEWAAYDFAAPRTARSEPQVAAPYVRLEDNMTWWALGATIPVETETHLALGLSAVVEEKDGTKSYWALAHANGDKPDFHDPACFAAHLP
ncbi:MAG: DOMON-like domain-containing protein [Sphingomonas sp.]